MSFILDALKKSENERKRTIGPSLIDAPLRRPQTERPWWAFAVAALLIVNLGVLVVVLIRKDSGVEANPALSAPPAVAAPAPATNVPPDTASPPIRNQNARPTANPAVRSLAEEAAGYGEDQYLDDTDFDLPISPALARAGAVPAGPPIVRPLDRSRDELAATRPNSDTGFDPSANARENLPTLSSLTASGAVSLPDLRLDIHVYSDRPADRFVFVNMRKYLEGQTLSEGPTIERITADGVVLNNQGVRLLLPRQ